MKPGSLDSWIGQLLLLLYLIFWLEEAWFLERERGRDRERWSSEGLCESVFTEKCWKHAQTMSIIHCFYCCWQTRLFFLCVSKKQISNFQPKLNAQKHHRNSQAFPNTLTLSILSWVLFTVNDKKNEKLGNCQILAAGPTKQNVWKCLGPSI